jgi:hypothetical protein
MPTSSRIAQIHQIEITSRCNLACIYCPHAKMQRSAVDMTDETFERCLKWIQFFGVPEEVNIAGIGEPLLHPRVVGFVSELRRQFPETSISLPTNGLLLDEEMARQLAPYHPEVAISMHVPQKAARAVEVAKQYGILSAVALDPVTSPNDWAGQVDWIKPRYRFNCPWLWVPQAFVTSQGDILRCCLDVEGKRSKIGSVFDEPAALETGRWELCRQCYQIPP